MGEQKELPRRKLRVVSLEKLGKTQKGGWIYKVNAVDAEGAPVEEELRAFEELPSGELIEYAVKKFESEKYGVSWTLFPPKEVKKNKEQRVQDLEDEVADLKKRVDALEGGNAQPPSRVTGAEPAIKPKGDGSQFGEEPPF